MKLLIPCVLISVLLLYGCDMILDENNLYDYSIEQQMGCYCPQGGIWVKLYISSDTVSSALRISDKQELPHNEFSYYKPIKGLFDIISETDTSEYDLIVEFDSLKNYPSFVYINPKPIIVNDSTIVIIEDAQIVYTTRNYIKLK